MKYLNKFITIALYSFVCCNILSLSNASETSEDLLSEINMYINHNEINSYINHNEINSLSSNTSIEQEIDTNIIDININNVDWKYRNQTQIIQDNINYLNSVDNESNNKQINKNNLKPNKLIEFCLAFKNGTNIADSILNKNSLEFLLKYLANEIDISNELKYIVSLHELLFSMSSYYLLNNNFDKKSISSEFKQIAKEFIKKSKNCYEKISMLINLKIKIYNNFKQTVKKFAEEFTNVYDNFDELINIETKIHNDFMNKYSKCLYKLHKYHNNKYSFLD